jgi:hypothetical protein
MSVVALPLGALFVMGSLFATPLPAEEMGASSTTLRAAPTPVRATETDEPRPAVEGLYPMWEHTGTLDAPGAARVGWGHASVGLGPVSLSTQPYMDLYGTANAAVKVALYQGPRVSGALVLAGYRVPTAAETHGIGTLNMTKFGNPFAPVWLLPLTGAVTTVLTPRVHLHLAATMLATRSGETTYESLTGGLAGFCEWFASPSRSVRLHAGAEGWPTWTQEHVGLSFAWRLPHVALAAGYARRFDPGGTSDSVFMWDAGLMFP